LFKRSVSFVFILFLLAGAFSRPDRPQVFTETTSGAYFYDDSDFIYLGNGFLEIQFSKDSKGLVYSLVNKFTGRDYRSIKTCQAPAWRIILTDMSDLKMYGTLEERNFTGFDFYYQNITGGVRLLLRYSECGYSGLTVITTVSAFDNSSLTFWRVNITCPATYNFSIDQIYIPLVTGLEIGGSELSYPKVAGYGIYPAGGVEMQLSIVEDKVGGGMYWATYDTDCYAKLHGRVDQDGGGGRYMTVVHYNSLEAGVDYNMTYDTVLGVFEGDMNQALDIYRDWASKQWWVSNGTILQRTDLPNWFKEGFTTMVACSYGGTFEDGKYVETWKSVDFDELPGLVDEYANGVQSPILVRWLGWEKYGVWVSPDCLPPLEGEAKFKSTIDKLHEKGHHVIVGLSAGIWDTFFESYNTTGRLYTKYYRFPLPPFATITPSVWRDGEREVADISLACEQWQDILVNITKYLAQAGVDGVQLDCFLSAPCDFSPLYDHPMGYGNWYTHGVLKALYKIKNAARLFNPNFLIATEFISEPFLPFVDLFIGDQFNRQRCAPFEYVYRRYCIPIGREFYQKFSYDQETLKKAFAYGSVSGTIAEFNSWGREAVPSEKLLLEITFANHALLPEFYNGHLLECESYNNMLSRRPDILSSVWSDDYGSIGFLYVNVGNVSSIVTINGDLLPYNMGEANRSMFLATHYRFDFVYPADAPSKFALNITLEPDSLLLLGMCPIERSSHFFKKWQAAVASYSYSSVSTQCSYRDIPVSTAVRLFTQARQHKAVGNYHESLASAASALLDVSHTLGRFAFLLNDSQSFEHSISRAEILFEAGMYFESATEIFDVCYTLLENLQLTVFFDRLHTDKDYFSSFRYDIFDSHFESSGYNVTMSQTLPLSWTNINRKNAAIFWVPSLGFSSNETSLILEYLNEGGNLILLLDAGLPDSINQLTKTFGVQVFPGAVIAKNYLWDEGSFSVGNFTEHPITDGVSYTEANWIAPVKTIGVATPLAYTSSNTWTSDDLGITGPFAYLAISTYGPGKVLVIADNLFMEAQEHLKMLDNAFSWFFHGYWQAYLVDLNEDGRINILDITIVATAYGSLAGSQNWNELADLDVNGVVNILDIAMVAKSYGRIL
jgi:hypothetical protein